MSQVLGVIARVAIGFCILNGIFLHYIIFGDVPYGIQFATLIAYSIVVFLHLFCDTRFLKGFDFYGEASKQSALRLLTVHGSCLILIFTIQTLAFKFEPKLPIWWTSKNGPKDDTPLQIALLALIFALGTIQVIFSRRILSRAERDTESA